MNFQELLKTVRDLDIPAGSFAIFGSGPMAIRNLKEPNDLDIIVTKEIYKNFKDVRGWTEKSFNNGEKFYLEKDGLELWNDWGPGKWDISKLIKDAEVIDDLPYVTLDQVLLWKERNGRPKDLIDIERIKSHLAI